MILKLNRRSTRAMILVAALGLVPAALLVPSGFAQVTPPATAPAGAVAGAPTSQPAAAAVANSPTMIDLRQMLDDKNYADLVKQANKLLQKGNDPNIVISRFQVVMLKGEGQAGLKLTALAVDTFKSAAKETKDPREMALAFWTSELFHRSSGMSYIPKSVGVGGVRQDPIPLLDLSNRTAAFQALLDDQLSQLEPRIKTAATSQTLPPIMPVLDQVVQLNHLEEIANGNDDKTAKVAAALLTHSKNLLVTAVKGMWNREGDIENAAKVPVPVVTQTSVGGILANVTGTRKTGLSRDNINELRNIIDTCSKVHEATSAFLEMAKTDDGWSALSADSDRVAARANDLLNADYTTVTQDPGQVAAGTNPYQNGTDGTNTPVYVNGQPVYPNGNNTYFPGTSYPTNSGVPPVTTSGGATPSMPTTPTTPTTPTPPSTPTTPNTPTNPATPKSPVPPTTPKTPATPPPPAPTPSQQAPTPSRPAKSGTRGF